jgi:hypothetical protein
MAAVSLDTLYDKYFALGTPTGCAIPGCHGTGQAGLKFNDAQQFWAATVNVPSFEEPSLVRVKPGDPTASYLFQKLSPSAAVRMPNGGPYLDDTALAQVGAWICAGAPEGGLDAGPGLAITGFSPASGVVNTLVTITGSGFSPFAADNQVTFDGVSAEVSKGGMSAIEARVPAGASTGKIGIAVANSTATSTTDFQVLPGNPLPALGSLSPSLVTPGSGAVAVTVSGSGFIMTSAASLDGSPRPTSFQSSTQLSVSLTAADTQYPAVHDLSVTNPSPGGGTSNSLTFTAGNPIPAITSLSPCGLVAGSPGFTLTIDGSGFLPASTATFNGVAVGVTFVSASELTATIPASAISAAPAGDSAPVVVSSPTPGGGPSTPAIFGVAGQVASISTNVQPVFTTNCATSECHVAVSTAPMSLEAGQSYASLVGVVSTECSPTPRVLACGPLRSQSVLADKILATSTSPPCFGVPMPNGQTSLPEAQQQLIIDWIAQGAPP